MTVECHQTDTNSVRHTTEHDSKDAAISTHSYTVDERRMVRANAKDLNSIHPRSPTSQIRWSYGSRQLAPNPIHGQLLVLV